MTDVHLQEITSVVWVDDDGTRYRRYWDDGEIVDEVVEA